MNDAVAAGAVPGLDELKRRSGWVIVLGIILVAVGILAILAPLVSGAFIALSVGVLFVVGGAVQIVYALRAGSWKCGILGFVSGALFLVCGVLMVLHPLVGLAFMTLLLAVFFWVDGVARIALSLQARPLRGWGWILFGGLLSILLGIMIFAKWPLSGAWAVGTLVGIDLLYTGWSMIALALAARGAGETAPGEAA